MYRANDSCVSLCAREKATLALARLRPFRGNVRSESEQEKVLRSHTVQIDFVEQ